MQRKNISKVILTLLVGCLIALSFCNSVMAGDGSGGGGGGGNGSGSGGTTITTDSGNGDGTGGGSGQPLSLVSSTPVANSTNVAVDTPIALEFSKNIAYATVRDINLKALSLWAGEDQINAEITMADDQLQPDLKNLINIIPAEPLKDGTIYTIKVNNTLTAKNGTVLESPLAISFTTAPLAETTKEASGLNNSWLIIGVLAVIVIVVAAIGLRRKKS